MKRLFLVVMLLLLLPAAGLSAQDTSGVTRIALDSKAANIQLSPDGHTLATYANAFIYDTAPTPDLIAVHLFDLSSGDAIGTLSGFTDWVSAADFSPDGSQLITFHRNGDLNLWNVADLSLIETIPTYTFNSTWVQFLGDGTHVIYRAGEMLLGILDLDSGAITQLIGEHFDSFTDYGNYAQYPAHGDVVIAGAAVSPDGHWLATSTANDAVYLWDLASGERTALRPSSEKFGQFNIRAFAFSSDSSQLVYFDGGDKQMHVWDLATQTETLVLDAGAAGFAVTPDLSKLAWADRATGAVYVADFAAGAQAQPVFTLPDDLQVAPNVTSVAFTADGSRLVVGGLFGSDDGSAAYVIDLAS